MMQQPPHNVGGCCISGQTRGSGLRLLFGAVQLGTVDLRGPVRELLGDTEGTYWLAMKFTADGFNGDTETGIWLVSGLDAASAAPVMSVDGFAKQFTHWPTQINGTELNGTEEKAKAAAACLA